MLNCSIPLYFACCSAGCVFHLFLLCLAGINIGIVNAPLLQDLDLFARITTIPGDVELYLLPSVPSLAALANLQTIGLNLVVGANAKLTSLTGLGECSLALSHFGHAMACCHCVFNQSGIALHVCLPSVPHRQRDVDHSGLGRLVGYAMQ